MSDLVLLVTCAAFPDGDEDGPEILAALQRAGVSAEWRAWDDASAPWSDSLVVLRAAWDYTLRREEFLTWTRSVPRLLNSHDTVLWNSDKVYLRDLEAAGIAVTPTEWAAPGEDAVLPAAGEFVVKPSVGAGSRGAGRFVVGDPTVDKHVASLHAAGRTVMVQPYLDGVDTEGETALVYLDGRYSHAARKAALLEAGAAHDVAGAALYVEEEIAPREASAAQRAVGDAALAVVAERFGVPLYARIDLLPGPDGPVVVEVEVTEPSLFLAVGAGAADRLATAIAARL